jgi:hypothetical protein
MADSAVDDQSRFVNPDRVRRRAEPRSRRPHSFGVRSLMAFRGSVTSELTRGTRLVGREPALHGATPPVELPVYVGAPAGTRTEARALHSTLFP